MCQEKIGRPIGLPIMLSLYDVLRVFSMPNLNSIVFGIHQRNSVNIWFPWICTLTKDIFSITFQFSFDPIVHIVNVFSPCIMYALCIEDLWMYSNYGSSLSRHSKVDYVIIDNAGH